MSTADQKELKQIREMLAEHIADFRVLKTALMGDDKAEIKEGRLPRLEATVASHGTRLCRQEKSRWLAQAISMLAIIIVNIAAFIYYIHNIARH